MSRPITLSTRLMLTLGGSLLALALAIGITAHQGMARILDAALNDKAHSLARQLGIVATDALLIYDYGTLERYVEDLAATPNIRYLEVRSAAGELLAHAGAQDRQQGHNIVRGTCPPLAHTRRSRHSIPTASTTIIHENGNFTTIGCVPDYSVIPGNSSTE